MPMDRPMGGKNVSRVSMAREIDIRELSAIARRRAWSVSMSFGLECRDPAGSPAPRPAGIPVTMTPRDARSFTGFHDERATVSGGDALEVLSRMRMCEAGVEGLHVAEAEDGRPIYAQWLIGPEEQAELHALTNGLFPQLADGEGLLEGAYTFAAFRKLGAMSDGMHQLLDVATRRRMTRCITYVSPGNVPSLRGCANAGFTAGHARVTRTGVGLRRHAFRALEPGELEVWRAAVGDADPSLRAAEGRRSETGPGRAVASGQA